MGMDLPYARHLFELFNLRIFAPKLLHCLQGSFLHGLRFIHQTIETMKLITNMKMLHPLQIIMAPLNPIDGFACYINNTPMTVHSFNLVFQYHLLIAKIYIVLNCRLKYSALIIFSMINPFQLPQSKKTTQLVGINLISLIGAAVDQGVLLGIRADDFRYIRPGHLGSPIGKITFLQCKVLLFCFNTLEGLDNVLLRCGKPSVAKKSSVNINVAEDTVTSMYIYSQLCYLFHWTTSFVVYLVCCVTPLYTKVVRFSFNQRSRRRVFFPWPGAPLFSGTGLWPGKRASASGESSLAWLQ